MVILSIGQSKLFRTLAEAKGIEMVNGRVKADAATGQTTNARYFAGGDCVNGGREVVDAVAEGTRAARAIAARFENR
jgi:glutamate synthase (NADPH/NADH) small chain